MKTDRMMLEEVEFHLENMVTLYGKDPAITHVLTAVQKHLAVQDEQLDQIDAQQASGCRYCESSQHWDHFLNVVYPDGSWAHRYCARISRMKPVCL